MIPEPILLAAVGGLLLIGQKMVEAKGMKSAAEAKERVELLKEQLVDRDDEIEDLEKKLERVESLSETYRRQYLDLNDEFHKYRLIVYKALQVSGLSIDDLDAILDKLREYEGD